MILVLSLVKRYMLMAARRLDENERMREMYNSQWPYYGDMSRIQSTVSDYGPYPFTINIHQAAQKNNNFRTALWTGRHMQITLMSILPGEDIGLEIHPQVDQFLRIEQGQGIVQFGDHHGNLRQVTPIQEGSAIVIPAGTWHNVMNTGSIPLKLYSIYAPPNHPFGTVHRTKAEAMAAHEHEH